MTHQTDSSDTRQGTSRALGAALALALLALPAGLTAQAPERPFSFNVRGGLNVPTFDIADVADPGAGFGAGVKVRLSERFFLRGNADFGFHPGAEGPAGVDGPDVDVFHYIAGAGYMLTPPESPFYASVNVGAGALNFAPDTPADDSFTYFAINAGGEVGYWLNDNISIFFSPQGDIAFSDEEEVGTDNSWVWPFTAGIEIRP